MQAAPSCRQRKVRAGGKIGSSRDYGLPFEVVTSQHLRAVLHHSLPSPMLCVDSDLWCNRRRNHGDEGSATVPTRLAASTGNVPAARAASVSVAGSDSGNVDGDRVEAEATEHLLGLDVDLERGDLGVESRDLGNVLVLRRVRVEERRRVMSAMSCLKTLQPRREGLHAYSPCAHAPPPGA